MKETNQPGETPDLDIVNKLNTASLDAVDAMRSIHQVSVEGYSVGDSIFVDGNSERHTREYTPITVDADLDDVVSTCVERMNSQGMAYGIDVRLDIPGANDGETINYLIHRQASRENIDDYFSFMLLPESIASYDFQIAHGKSRKEALEIVSRAITKERVNEGNQIFMDENKRYYSERILLRAKQD